MNENKKEELRTMLESLPDSYEDFVHGIMLATKKHSGHDELAAYLRENPHATTDDVIVFTNKWRGCLKGPDEKQKAV